MSRSPFWTSLLTFPESWAGPSDLILSVVCHPGIPVAVLLLTDSATAHCYGSGQEDLQFNKWTIKLKSFHSQSEWGRVNKESGLWHLTGVIHFEAKIKTKCVWGGGGGGGGGADQGREWKMVGKLRLAGPKPQRGRTVGGREEGADFFCYEVIYQ